MHLFFYLRGINNQVELWKTLAQTIFWKWRRINLKTNQEETILVQGALRPSVLGAYEYIFPEEALSEVIATFGLTKGNIGADPTFSNKAKLFILKEVFGAKNIPDKNYEEASKIPPTILVNGVERGIANIIIAGVTIHVIGIKKDERRKDENFGYEQEML